MEDNDLSGEKEPQDRPIVELRTIMCGGHGCGPCFLIVNADKYEDFPHDGYCWVDGTKETIIQAPGVSNINREEINKLAQMKSILNNNQEE